MNLRLIDDYTLLLKFLSRAGSIKYRCSSGKLCTLYMNDNMCFFVDGAIKKTEIKMDTCHIRFFISRLKTTPAICTDVYPNRWEELQDTVSNFDRKVVCLNGKLS